MKEKEERLSMKEIFDTTMPVPETVLDEPEPAAERQDHFSGTEIFGRRDTDEIFGQTRAELVGDKLFYGAVGVVALTLTAAGAATAKRLARH